MKGLWKALRACPRRAWTPELCILGISAVVVVLILSWQ